MTGAIHQLVSFLVVFINIVGKSWEGPDGAEIHSDVERWAP